MKKNTTVEYEFYLEDVRRMIAVDLGIRMPLIEIVSDIKKTESIPGIDPHDCDYVDRFAGIKVRVKQED